MTHVKTDGIVLRVTDFSESSQVVALCTRARGQVHLLAKGARRPRKDGRSPFHLLARCNAVFSTRSRTGLYTATDWSVTNTYRRLSEDLDCFYAAMYACEIVLASTQEVEEGDGVFGELSRFLEELDAGEDPAETRLFFEIRLLRELGLAPSVESCSHCGGPLNVQPRFSARAGGAVCDVCGASDASACRISLGALAVWRRLLDAQHGERVRLVLSSAQRSEIDRALREHFEYQIGRRLRTADYTVGKTARLATDRGTGVGRNGKP